MRRAGPFRRYIVALAFIAGLLAHDDADAGWRELGLVMVPMHAKDDASARACYTKLRKELTGEEGSDVVHIRQSRENLARKLGESVMGTWTYADAEAFKPMLEWQPKTWRDPAGKTIGGGYVIDAWVLIDCQPEAQTLDLVSVVPSTNSVSRLHLGGREIDAGARSLAAKIVFGHAWADWEP